MWTIFYVASISIPTLYEMVYEMNDEMKSTPYPTAHKIDKTYKVTITDIQGPLFTRIYQN